MSDQWGVPEPERPGHVADPYGGGGGGKAGAYAGAPYYGAGPRRTNGTALAGAILSVLPPLGLALSVAGLSRAKALEGAGRTAASFGIVLSLVFAGGYGVGIYEMSSSANVDPACASVLATESALGSDESALTTFASAGGEVDARSELGTMASELQTLESQLSGDAARAKQADVRARILAVDGDLRKMIVDVKTLEGEWDGEGGDDSALSALEGTARQLEADGAAMDSACGQAG